MRGMAAQMSVVAQTSGWSRDVAAFSMKLAEAATKKAMQLIAAEVLANMLAGLAAIPFN